MNLRPYQIKVIEDFQREVAADKKRIIIVAPTGAGKTVIAAAIIKSVAAKRRGVLVLAHRREIIAQTSEKLHAQGVPHGIIQAGITPRPLEDVQVASIQTLWTRAMHTGRMELPQQTSSWSMNATMPQPGHIARSLTPIRTLSFSV
jgi:superfamily II DNA or RNA helicase